MANTFGFPTLEGVNLYQGQQTKGANPSDAYGKDFYEWQTALRKTKDPIVRAKIWLDYTQSPSYMCMFDGLLGSDTFCGSGVPWQIQFMTGQTDVIQFANPAAVPIAVGGTATVPLAAGSFTTGGYALPQVGGSVLMPSTGATSGLTNIFLEVTAVTVANPVTVTLKNNSTEAQSIAAGVKGIPVTARAWADCECPASLHTGSNPPILEDYDFIPIQDAKKFCGKELEECEHNFFNFTTIDENGNSVENETYAKDVLVNFDRDYERAIQLAVMHHNKPNQKGIIPQLKEKSIRWTTDSLTEITLADIEELIGKFKENGVKCKTFYIKAGFEKFKQYQTLVRTLAEGKIVFGGCAETVADFCNSLNLLFCSFSHLGYTFFISDEDCFSNTQSYGAFGTYVNSAIIYPMEKRSTVGNNRSKFDMHSGNDGMQMGTLVYKRTKGGRVYDRYTEATGYGTDRNNNKAGCKDMEVSKETFVAVELYQRECWVLQDFN